MGKAFLRERPQITFRLARRERHLLLDAHLAQCQRSVSVFWGRTRGRTQRSAMLNRTGLAQERPLGPCLYGYLFLCNDLRRNRHRCGLPLGHGPCVNEPPEVLAALLKVTIGVITGAAWR